MEVVDRPALREHQIDEQRLQAELDERIQYKNPEALYRDVSSVSAVMRLRRSRVCADVEECRALFVTTNAELARVATKVCNTHPPDEEVPPGFTDHWLTTLLWLKTPLRAPDLPKKRLIADCYAAVQPSERLWRRYLEEINKLETRRSVTTDDYYRLRFSLEAKNGLMARTLGEEDVFTQGTVQEILEEVRHKETAALEAQHLAALSEEQSKAKAAEEQADGLRRRAQSAEARLRIRQDHIRRLATTAARSIVKALRIVALAVVATGVLTSFPYDLPPVQAAWWRYGVSLALFAVLVLSVANLMIGTTVESMLRALEVRLTSGMQGALGRWLEGDEGLPGSVEPGDAQQCT